MAKKRAKRTVKRVSSKSARSVKRAVKNAKENKDSRNLRKVNWIVCLVISVIFGSLGVDRFIMGKIGTGLLKLVTFGGLGIWWLVDVILIASKYEYKGIKWE